MIDSYCSRFSSFFPDLAHLAPWHIVRDIQKNISAMLKNLPGSYRIVDNVAIHESAVIEGNVVFKGPIIIYENCFVGAHSYLRGGVLLLPNVSIGPGCEIKSSIILNNSATAHFNFVGDAIMGSFVNMEAGSIVANHHNDREDKSIYVDWDSAKTKTDVQKFGGVIGDYTKIGANAVLSPGTILTPHSIVKRLQLVEQN